MLTGWSVSRIVTRFSSVATEIFSWTQTPVERFVPVFQIRIDLNTDPDLAFKSTRIRILNPNPDSDLGLSQKFTKSLILSA